MRIFLNVTILPPRLGEILEIGSFKGKSTTVLAKSVPLIGGNRVVAVDPFVVPPSTNPSIACGDSPHEKFLETLETNGVRHLVEFHHLRSEELAPIWTRAIRFLWIDGDHTYQGALSDMDNYCQYLRPGAIIAFHDVLNAFEGPIRVYCDRVLLSPAFGPCGVCGSIGWAQYIGGESSIRYTSQKRTLYRRLCRLIPFVALNGSSKSSFPYFYKLVRWLVPHGNVDANAWKIEIESNLEESACGS